MAKKIVLTDNSGNKCYTVTRDECVKCGDRTLPEKFSELGTLKSSDSYLLNNRNYSGYFVSNVNTGQIGVSNANSNSYFIEVEPNSKYKITLPNGKYTTLATNIQVYSDYPSEETNLGYAGKLSALKEDVLTIPSIV